MNIFQQRYTIEILWAVRELGGEATVYEVAKKIQSRYGEIHRKMKLLEERGLLKFSRVEMNEKKGTIKKYYQLTPKGEDALKNNAKILKGRILKDLEILMSIQGPTVLSEILQRFQK